MKTVFKSTYALTAMIISIFLSLDSVLASSLKGENEVEFSKKTYVLPQVCKNFLEKLKKERVKRQQKFHKEMGIYNEAMNKKAQQVSKGLTLEFQQNINNKQVLLQQAVQNAHIKFENDVQKVNNAFAGIPEKLNQNLRQLRADRNLNIHLLNQAHQQKSLELQEEYKERKAQTLQKMTREIKLGISMREASAHTEDLNEEKIIIYDFYRLIKKGNSNENSM